MMKWRKKGRIFSVQNNYKWMKTHSSLPIADRIKDDLYKIYFSTRDSNNKSNVGFLEVNINDPSKILKISKNPILSPGLLGSFDEDGVIASSLVTHKGKKFLYYVGWNRGTKVPFRWSVGLAISKNNGKNFQKFSDGPILDRNQIDPYLVSSPTVILENGLWRMWYISALKWVRHGKIYRAPYHIRYAESKNGIDWKRDGTICIDFKNKKEFAIGRASIIKEKGIYQMWYSYSSGNYRIGYAESKNGIKWKRLDKKSGITVSKTGWDSKMIEHCFVFRHKSKKFMLYTGNDYGKSGFGYAEFEK